MTLPLEARNEVPFIIVGFADRPVSNVWRSQPLIFYRQKLCKIIFANLKNLFSLICGFRFPDSGFRILVSYSGFRIPDSGFRLRIPVSGFRLLELPNSDIINCRILSAGQLSTGNHSNNLPRASELQTCLIVPLKLIRQSNERFTHDRSAFDVPSLTLFVAMFCSQITMSRMYFDFQQRGSRISSLQQIFLAVLGRIKVQAK